MHKYKLMRINLAFHSFLANFNEMEVQLTMSYEQEVRFLQKSKIYQGLALLKQVQLETGSEVVNN